ncbi:MAG: hypothetical protein WA988_10515 [Candidatus Nanopelagicales bacterium]
MSFKVGALVTAGVTAATAAVTAATLKILLSRRPALPSDPQMYAEPVADSDADDNPGELRATFLGVSTIAFTDGETTIVTDGFFSRPSAQHVLAGRVSPNHAVIDDCLRKAGIDEAAAILVAHSHYDHALDAPAVAWRTGAMLVGSESTLNIGRGYGLSDDQMQLVDVSEPLKFGRFTVEMILSEHSPHGKFKGLIESPLRAPARAKEYKMAECYSMLITHASAAGRTRRVLVHASAGFKPGCLEGRRADVVFLGIAPVGKQSDQFRDDYWRETVQTIKARRVFPIHWDDFTLPLSEPLQAMPYVADDFTVTMDFLEKRRVTEGVEIVMPKPFERIDPFTGLGSTASAPVTL